MYPMGTMLNTRQGVSTISYKPPILNISAFKINLNPIISPHKLEVTEGLTEDDRGYVKITPTSTIYKSILIQEVRNLLY